MPNTDMLINYVPDEECRIALVEDGRLEDLYTERTADALHVGNIYRGRVTNVEPAIQAAFIDFGLDRHGFLHISDLHPRYFPGEDEQTTEKVGKRTPRRERPPIQKALKRGMPILVQVLKEGIGTKGPTLTSYLSIPGRYLVMMPQMERHGVSRKVEDEQARRDMRKILAELNPPDNFGFIVRTAGIGRPKTELKRDMAYLLRLWKTIQKRMKQESGPAELFTESDLIIRTIRDVMTPDVQRIIVDNWEAASRAHEFLRIASPRTQTKVIYYDKPMPLFHAFDIESQISAIHSRVVSLPSGVSLSIEQTEAMVAIDVNSGKFRDHKDAEETAYRTNLEAVDEICRQLRLRDLGGLVLCDLIDMYVARHRREVEKRLRDNLKKDRARSKALKISEFGIVEMTRQRMRPAMGKSLFQTCIHCQGVGRTRTPEAAAIDVTRKIAVVLHGQLVQKLQVTVHPEVGAAMLNRRRATLVHLEKQFNKDIDTYFDPSMAVDDVRMVGYDHRGIRIDVEHLPQGKKPTDDELRIFDPDAYQQALDQQKVKEEEIEATVTIEDQQQGQRPIAEDDDDLDLGDFDIDDTDEDETSGGDSNQEDPSQEDKPRKRRRRRRRRRGKGKSSDDAQQQNQDADEQQDADSRSQDRSDDQETSNSDDAQSTDDDQSSDESSSKPKRRRRRRRRKSRSSDSSENSDTPSEQSSDDDSRSQSSIDSKDEPDKKSVSEEVGDNDSENDNSDSGSSGDDDSQGGGKKKTTRRRRSRSRSRSKSESGDDTSSSADGESESQSSSDDQSPSDSDAEDQDKPATKKKRSRRSALKRPRKKVVGRSAGRDEAGYDESGA